jgi:hypothetical protein
MSISLRTGARHGLQFRYFSFSIVVHGKVHAEVHACEVDCGSGGSDGAMNSASGDSWRVTLRSLAVNGSSQHSKRLGDPPNYLPAPPKWPRSPQRCNKPPNIKLEGKTQRKSGRAAKMLVPETGRTRREHLYTTRAQEGSCQGSWRTHYNT